MQIGEQLGTMCWMAWPVAAVFGAGLRKLPQWLRETLGSTCSAACLRDDDTLASPEGTGGGPSHQESDGDTSAPERPRRLRSSGGEEQSLVDEMLRQGRYALLLRPQLIDNLTPAQWEQARFALSDGMCLVPEGDVNLQGTAGREDDEDAPREFLHRLHAEAYFIDRYPVTNAEYLQFVDSGGYEQMQIWDAEVLPAVLDFVDLTGHPGPRYWRNGRPARGLERHPVVGICWYEACAFARWSGKRLATDAEWVKAGSWPVDIAGQRLLQRRYPWGEAIDRTRANLWGSGPGNTVPVDEFPGGISVGGVQQLIGNVWEWTADAFKLEDDLGGQSAAPEEIKLKSIRGGAFDTYLDCQATCHFQSGDRALARKHNIGFRCAISWCDVSRRELAEPSLVQPAAE